MASPLDKIVRLAQDKTQADAPDDIRVLVQAAHVALTGACWTDDPVTAADLVYAAAAQVEKLAAALSTDLLPADLVAAAMAAGTSEDEILGLSVLTAEGRRQAKADGFTIGGSDDYPIPDKGHLSAAIARYKEGKHAGHPASAVKAHILKHARRLGVEVDLVAPAILTQIRDGEATVFLAAPPEGAQDIPLHHAPFTGTHDHAHHVGMAHGHEHSHHGDAEHAGPVHGKNSKQKAWADKGESRRPY